ncbi:MAG: septal ring lytic transglycosylase RlpA family protein [Peptococcaceae bacterium]
MPQAVFADTKTVDNFHVVMDNNTYKFMQSVVQKEEETFVPMRSFLNIFGARIAWNKEVNSTTILADDKEYLLIMDLDNLTITYNDSVKPIELVDNQVYVPLSFLQGILNYQLSWDEANTSLTVMKVPDTVTIFKNLSEAPHYTIVDTLEGTASWYGGKFHGNKTTSGEIFDQEAFTAAHRTLPFGTYLRVTFLETDQYAIVKVNDRGPHVAGRILDLSKGAAEEIGLKAHGTGKVKIEVLDNYCE